MSFSPADLARQTTAVEPESIDDVIAEADEALVRLDHLAQLPTVEHVAVYEGVQQALSNTLTAVDEA